MCKYFMTFFTFCYDRCVYKPIAKSDPVKLFGSEMLNKSEMSYSLVR